MNDPLLMSIHALMGLSLAACTGLRAFMPLFVVGLLARINYMALGADFGWLASDAALICFGVATVVEIAADKFPLVDNMLDGLQLVIKPIAATLIFASVMVGMDPLQATVLGLVSAGSTATVMHLKKATARGASTLGTLGFANPALSTMEDVLCGGGVLVSVVAPVLAFICLVLGMALTWWVVKRIRARRMATPVP